MDVDESFESATSSESSPACPLSQDTPQLAPFPSSTATPTSSTTEYDSEPELELAKEAPLAGLFKNLSPTRRGARRSLHEDSMGSVMQSFDDSPVHKKRRSFSPAEILRRQLSLEQDSLSSSPGIMESPSACKLERLQAKPLKALAIEPVVNANNKRPRRLALSALITPADIVVEDALKTARPVMQGSAQEKDDAKARRFAAPPVRRAFSAAYPANMHVVEESQDSVDVSSSRDSDALDMSSPALAYAKRQQVKTIRRCDGTDDFRSMTGATAMLKRDSEMRRGRKSDEGVVLERDTPRSKYLNAGTGLGGFGDNEAHGKILPCHRVKEDGLMRITARTVIFNAHTINAVSLISIIGERAS